MGLDERFDDLVTSLAGFHRAWTVAIGLELGFFAHIRDAGGQGIDPVGLARAAGAAETPVRAWCLAAFAADLVDFDGSQVRLDPDVAVVLLDEDRPEYLGGQFSYSVTASLDYDLLAEFVRTGVPIDSRPTRYYRAIERLTRQDIAVFFEEALAALPDLVADLVRGLDVVDLHCGGGRWLVAMARRFPACAFVGVEHEPDSVARALRAVREAALEERIHIEARQAEHITSEARFDLAYFQHALHELAAPAVALAAAWRALRPGGRLVVLGWCLPSSLEEYATLHGQLVSGVALDEAYGGARMRTLEEHRALFAEAGLPDPEVINLPSDATLLLCRRDA